MNHLAMCPGTLWGLTLLPGTNSTICEPHKGGELVERVAPEGGIWIALSGIQRPEMMEAAGGMVGYGSQSCEKVENGTTSSRRIYSDLSL
jgi:hypothetical protein